MPLQESRWLVAWMQGCILLQNCSRRELDESLGGVRKKDTPISHKATDSGYTERSALRGHSRVLLDSPPRMHRQLRCGFRLCAQTSVGEYFDSDGYLGQEEILAAFMKLVRLPEQASFSTAFFGVLLAHTSSTSIRALLHCFARRACCSSDSSRFSGSVPFVPLQLLLLLLSAPERGHLVFNVLLCLDAC